MLTELDIAILAEMADKERKLAYLLEIREKQEEERKRQEEKRERYRKLLLDACDGESMNMTMVESLLLILNLLSEPSLPVPPCPEPSSSSQSPSPNMFRESCVPPLHPTSRTPSPIITSSPKLPSPHNSTRNQNSSAGGGSESESESGVGSGRRDPRLFNSSSKRLNSPSVVSCMGDITRSGVVALTPIAIQTPQPRRNDREYIELMTNWMSGVCTFHRSTDKILITLIETDECIKYECRNTKDVRDVYIFCNRYRATPSNFFAEMSKIIKTGKSPICHIHHMKSHYLTFREHQPTAPTSVKKKKSKKSKL